MGESMSEGLPEWREHPGAVAEAVFFVGISHDSLRGKSRFLMGPERLRHGVRVKGDFTPDAEYAGAFSEVYSEIQSFLTKGIDVTQYTDGEMLLRFVAEQRLDGWSVVTYNEDIEGLVFGNKFFTFEVENHEE